MADWILVPCLVCLREEFNRIAPERDRTSDGSKGDDAHADRISDHNPDETGKVPIRDVDKTNEVHAIDVDDDLRVPGLTMEMVVQFLLARCRRGAETRLRYIIYNRRIWHIDEDWRQQSYTGDNPHDKHAHFSASYDTAKEASTASWELEEIPVALTADDKKFITDLFNGLKEEIDAVDKKVSDLTKVSPLNGPDGKPDGTQTTPIGSAALSQGIPNPFNGGKRSPAWLVLQQTAQAAKDLTEPSPTNV